MSSEPVYGKIPRDNKEIVDLLNKVNEIEQKAIIDFYQENYETARNGFFEAYQLQLVIQKKVDRSVHKGAVLYNLGLSILGTRKKEDIQHSLKYIILAYIEDTLGTPFDFEDNADRAPAGRFLYDGFIIQLRFLREIKKTSNDIKRNINYWIKANSENIFSMALKLVNVSPDNVLSLCERPDVTIGPTPLGFPQPLEQRVFLGTKYDSFAHVLPDMRDAVVQKQYTPIIVGNVIIPPNYTVHDISLLLLHTCGYAVFEITNPAGQLMELERARDYGVNVLLLRSRPLGHDPHISAMISSLNYPLHIYHSTSDLKQAIRNFLP